MQDFVQFENSVKSQFNNKIKTIQCDIDGRYKHLQKHAIYKDIQFRIPCPYISHQNGMEKAYTYC